MTYRQLLNAMNEAEQRSKDVTAAKECAERRHPSMCNYWLSVAADREQALDEEIDFETHNTP